MKILMAGYTDSPLKDWLREQGEDVDVSGDKLTYQFVSDGGYDFLISYGCRHMITKDVLGYFEGRAINLHISYLPWNRGADPNLWSIIDGTKKGVTIHYLDEGLDTGDIIVQQEAEFDADDTLRSSYEKLQRLIQHLFMDNWAEIKTGRCGRTPQSGEGSYHRGREKEIYAEILSDGYDIKISDLLERINGEQNG